MLSVDFKGIDVPAAALQKRAKEFRPYLKKLRQVAESVAYTQAESSLSLPHDRALQEVVLEAVHMRVSKNIKYVIVIGIGGSNLGAKAVYDAFFGSGDILANQRFPRMLFSDTCDADFLKKITHLIKTEIKKPEEVLINLISKSGSTLESIVNAEMILAACKKKFGLSATLTRLVVTTDADSALWRWAGESGVLSLPIPQMIGGRYSIFSAVGLFPLAAIGFPIEELVEGAREVMKVCLSEGVKENVALASASTIFVQMKKGKTILDHFFFDPSLESLGKWCRQLLAESLGKRADLGLTPTVSIGSTDLHSMSQLYLAGPAHRMTEFVSVKHSHDEMRVPVEATLGNLGKKYQGRSIDRVMQAILEGTKIAYRKQSRPFFATMLSHTDARSVGAFMQYKMIQTMLVGRLMKINAFDQPAVEAYKKETRKILSV